MIFITLIACLHVCLAEPFDDVDWLNYKLEFGKDYSVDEDAHRYKIWLQNMKEIDMHNAKSYKTYTQAPNIFTDMTDEELEGYNGLNVPEVILNGSSPADTEFYEPLIKDYPPSVNWVEKGYVTPVKFMGRCAACYTFAATGALEGQWFKMHHRLISMSEQQIVDCSMDYGNHGCDGGWYRLAWKYIHGIGGIQSEESYPYTAKQGKCRFNSSRVVAKVKTWRSTRPGNELDLTLAVANVGPIAVKIDASRRSFHNYRSGVFYDKHCSYKRLTHCVLVVGYGRENGSEYYLVKNTRGTKWGEEGYIKMARNRNNNCGIATMPMFPLVP